jgi:hypothetical protein
VDDKTILDKYIGKHGRALGTAAFRIEMEERAAEQARQAALIPELDQARAEADAIHVANQRELAPFVAAVEAAQERLTAACARLDAKRYEHQAKMSQAHDRILQIRKKMGHIGIGVVGRIEPWKPAESAPPLPPAA